MLRTIRCTIFLCALISIPAFAQRVEIFGGAQFEHLENSFNAVGWNASLTGNFKHVLGITADFGGVYKSRHVNSSVYTYTVGPVLTARLPVVQPFVHALFGVARESQDAIPIACAQITPVCPGPFSLGSDTSFATAIGAGFDVKLAPFVKLRLIQVDYLRTQLHGATQNQPRASAGIVFHF